MFLIRGSYEKGDLIREAQPHDVNFMPKTIHLHSRYASDYLYQEFIT